MMMGIYMLTVREAVDTIEWSMHLNRLHNQPDTVNDTFIHSPDTTIINPTVERTTEQPVQI